MLRFLLVLLSIFLAGFTWDGKTISTWNGKTLATWNGAAVGGYGDIVLWEDFTDNSSPYSVTSSNCNTGTATEWTLNSTAAINGTAALSGSYGVQVPAAAASQYAQLVIASGDYFKAEKGAIVFMFRVVAWENGASLLWIRETSATTPDVMYVMMGGDSELQFTWRPNDVTERTCGTSGAAVNDSDTHYCVITWNSTADTMYIGAYTTGGSLEGSAGTNSSSMTAMPDIETGGYIRLGDTFSSSTISVYLDKLVIFDGSVSRTAQEYVDIVRNNSSCPL